jgi:hypothetical protein
VVVDATHPPNGTSPTQLHKSRGPVRLDRLGRLALGGCRRSGSCRRATAVMVYKLTSAAVALLRDLPRFVGDHGFTTTGGDRPISGFSKMKAGLDRLVPAWTLHDLRRTVRTGLSSLGVLPVITELDVLDRQPLLQPGRPDRAGVAGNRGVSPVIRRLRLARARAYGLAKLGGPTRPARR